MLTIFSLKTNKKYIYIQSNLFNCFEQRVSPKKNLFKKMVDFSIIIYKSIATYQHESTQQCHEVCDDGRVQQ